MAAESQPRDPRETTDRGEMVIATSLSTGLLAGKTALQAARDSKEDW